MKILVVGGYGGVGSGLVPLLSKHSEVVAVGHSSGSLALDVTDVEQIENVLYEIGHVDILVNCSGLTIDGFTHKISSMDWAKVMAVNLTGSYNLIRAVLPSMRKNNFGRIIMLSSILAHRPVMGTAAYTASKSGLEGLVRVVAAENLSKHVTCNSIAMGYFDMGMGSRLTREQKSLLLDEIPLARFGTIDELYNVVMMLINTEYITGQTIHINGGLFYG